MKTASKVRYYTFWILVITVVALVAWDIYAYSTHSNATFSILITDWSFYSPWMPFVVGVLIGHFFFSPMGSKYDHVWELPKRPK